ncbi:MAG: trehalose-phosphatase, partial [Pseudomonadales bacterium]
LQGKAGILREAARRLQVDPSDAVVLEDATSGVRAGREQGFGLVLGVSRNAHEDALLEAGAHEAYGDVYRAMFPRRLPSALEKLDDLLAWQGSRTPAVFLDYDGTLTPIVDDPDAARLPDEMRAVLTDLARYYPVAIVSGRDRADVQARADIEGLLYAGNHGFDIVGRGRENTLPEAERAVDEVRAAEAQLRRRVGDLPGVIIESKRFSVAVHYRQVRDADLVDRVQRIVAEVRDGTSLRKRTGKMVVELEPNVEWDKGRALGWLMDVMEIDAGQYFPMYIGDDDTDEDAFAALRDAGPGILVGDEICSSRADYRLADPQQVRRFLEGLRDRAAR